MLRTSDLKACLLNTLTEFAYNTADVQLPHLVVRLVFYCFSVNAKEEN